MNSNIKKPITFLLGSATVVFMTAMTPTPSPAPSLGATPAVPGAAAPAVAGVKEPAPVKNKKLEFSTRTDVNACTGLANESCSIDTFVVAKALDNQEIVWERRIYFRKYEATSVSTPPVILAKSLKLVGSKMLHVTNDRGDVYELEAEKDI